MGKATKWFRSFFNLKPKTDKQIKTNRRWSFVKSYREKDNVIPPATKHTGDFINSDTSSPLYVATSAVNQNALLSIDEYDHENQRAIAVAAATAAVADAAVVVRLTAGGRDSGELFALAAVKIQSAFRGYLAKRALRALRGLVRLQAMVRGHIERKQTAKKIQAMSRAQARARARRAQVSESSQSSSKGSHSNQPGPPTPEKVEYRIRSKSVNYEPPSMLKRNGSKSRGRTIIDQDRALQSGCNWLDRQIDRHSQNLHQFSVRFGLQDDETTDKILEIDTAKPHFGAKDRHIFHSTHLSHSDQYANSKDCHADISSYSCEVDFVKPLKFAESPFCTTDNSPQFYSASSKGDGSRRSPFTPTKSDCSRSFLSGYSDHPNYMSYTQSSMAKVRSISAPKQRPNYERVFSTKRNSIHGFGAHSHKISALHSNFAGKAYPGSGRLDNMGMPVGYRF
ncbi:hypothetical protein ACFE04_012997 [Oxalis oulophora]